ncbi:hypothetical protein [Loigolactobacillus iwatensis]|uniref:hypothetical protein n=1 Tax=Loigolactobacillus iwatensis TaxID=1267156 RepID=UPI000F7E105E|nr:hypothetical protein [Loigolactobacillus iwatensis]
MALTDEFLTRRFMKFQCWQCQHPGMEITGKTPAGQNDDQSTRYQIEMTCPRCHAKDNYFINDGEEGKITPSEKSGNTADPENIL